MTEAEKKEAREKRLQAIIEIGNEDLRNRVLDRHFKDELEEVRKERIDRSQHFQLTAGTVMLNPYVLTELTPGPGFEVSAEGDTDTHGFVEAAFNYREAWLSKTERETPGQGQESEDEPRVVPDDYEARLGFVLDTEDLSGSAAPGSGDAYLELMLGWNLFAPEPDGAGHRHTLNLETLLGLTTDVGAQDIHDYQGVGLTSVWGIERGDEARPIHVLVGGFWSRFEVPEFDGGVIVESNGFPEFDDEAGAIWRGDMHVPIGDAGYLTLSGRFHSGVSDLNPWTMSLGYTLPLAALFDGVGGD